MALALPSLQQHWYPPRTPHGLGPSPLAIATHIRSIVRPGSCKIVCLKQAYVLSAQQAIQMEETHQDAMDQREGCARMCLQSMTDQLV